VSQTAHEPHAADLHTLGWAYCAVGDASVSCRNSGITVGAVGAGDFIVDDDGGGYADVGEEEDWTAEPGAEADGEEQAAKRQKTGDAKKGGTAFNGLYMSWAPSMLCEELDCDLTTRMVSFASGG